MITTTIEMEKIKSGKTYQVLADIIGISKTGLMKIKRCNSASWKSMILFRKTFGWDLNKMADQAISEMK